MGFYVIIGSISIDRPPAPRTERQRRDDSVRKLDLSPDEIDLMIAGGVVRIVAEGGGTDPSQHRGPTITRTIFGLEHEHDATGT